MTSPSLVHRVRRSCFPSTVHVSRGRCSFLRFSLSCTGVLHDLAHCKTNQGGDTGDANLTMGVVVVRLRSVDQGLVQIFKRARASGRTRTRIYERVEDAARIHLSRGCGLSVRSLLYGRTCGRLYLFTIYAMSAAALLCSYHHTFRREGHTLLTRASCLLRRRTLSQLTTRSTTPRAMGDLVAFEQKGAEGRRRVASCACSNVLVTLMLTHTPTPSLPPLTAYQAPRSLTSTAGACSSATGCARSRTARGGRCTRRVSHANTSTSTLSWGRPSRRGSRAACRPQAPVRRWWGTDNACTVLEGLDRHRSLSHLGPHLALSQTASAAHLRARRAGSRERRHRGVP